MISNNYYLVDCNGEIHGESFSKEWLELLMEDLKELWIDQGKTQEQIDELQLEIIEGGTYNVRKNL